MKITKKERTRNEIIQVTKEIIHKKGYEAVTVRNIAEMTGYSHTNIYYYFKNMNDLLWALRLDMIEDMITELTSISYTTDDPIEEIYSMLCSYTNYFFEHPNVFSFFYFHTFIQPDGDNSFQKLDMRFNSMRQAFFSRLVQEEVIPASDSEILFKTIIYALQGMIMLSFSSNTSSKQEDITEELSKLIKYLFKKNEIT